MIKIYGHNECAECKAVKKRFDSMGVKYEYVNVKEHPEVVKELDYKGFYSVPVIEGVDKNGVKYSFQGNVPKYINKLLENDNQ